MGLSVLIILTEKRKIVG